MTRACAAFTLVTTFVWLLTVEPTVPPHPDEDQYIWSAAYFGGKLRDLDFRPSGTDLLRDPGWTPTAWWCLTQPMGARFLFAPVLGITRADTPAYPLLYDSNSSRGPDSEVTPETRRLIRTVAVAAGALGLALIVLRLGWWSVLPCLAFLALPSTQQSLIGAWAEGPLLLGFGLGVLAYQSRWFPLVCGVAATFKLTALGLWPLALLPGASGRFRPSLAVAIIGVSWSLLTPPSWFALGPFYLLLMLLDRFHEFQGQSAVQATMFGLYLPGRYFWPPLLFALLGLSWVIVRVAQREIGRRG